MRMYQLFLLMPAILFADQLILYKTVGGAQTYDLSSTVITFPDESTLKVGTSTISINSISKIEFLNGTTPISSHNTIEEPTTFHVSMNDGILDMNISEKGLYTIELYDMLGKKLDVLYNNTFDIGEHKICINKKEYASGMYYIVIKNTKNYVYQWRF